MWIWVQRYGRGENKGTEPASYEQWFESGPLSDQAKHKTNRVFSAGTRVALIIMWLGIRE